MSYQIFSDSSCDLPLRIIEKYNISIIPFYVSFDNENYLKENIDITTKDFYKQIIDNPSIYPKSSMPSTQDYLNAFKPYVKKGIQIICICITSKFSGSFTAATNAKQMLLETYPDVKITIIDSTVNTILQGLFVLEACRMQQNGLSYDNVILNLEAIKSTGRILFTIEHLEYLSKGGRIGKLANVAGITLGIKPLIVLKEGEIFPSGIIRTRKKGKQRLIMQMKDHFDNIKESPNDYSMAVGYGYDYEEACIFRDELLDSMKQYCDVKQIPIYQIGATIGVHTGPYPIGLGFIKKYDC